MLGTIVNTCCILLGSAIGSIAKKGLKPKFQEAIFTALGIATVSMGLNAVAQNMPNSSYPVLFIVSMAIGAVIGTALDLETRFKRPCREARRTVANSQKAYQQQLCCIAREHSLFWAR